jgi:hypothetical protein
MASGDEDLVVPRLPVAAGPPPTLVRADNPTQEAVIVRTQAAEFAKDRSVAILARTWALAQRAASGLNYRKLEAEMHTWNPGPRIWVGPYHAAKGLEFDAVIMPYLNDDTVPWPDVVAAFAREEADAREARLLYVALTRARSELLMTYSGNLTPLLPTTPGLWSEVDPA